MRIGLLACPSADLATMGRRCESTLLTIASAARWRFGQTRYASNETSIDVLVEEIEHRKANLSRPGNWLASFSAAAIDGDKDAIIQFDLRNTGGASAVRIRLESSLDTSLAVDVNECCACMETLIEIWKPETAYVTSFRRLEQLSPHLIRSFPSGYAIYRNRRASLPSDYDAVRVEALPLGTYIRFTDAVLTADSLGVEDFEHLIAASGGIDQRYSVLT